MHAHLPILRSDGFYTMDSGGLGYGMPAAVGVALAKRGTRVIGVIGDGSSLYSIQAIWSAAQLGLPVTFVILKNGRYAALQDFAPVFGFSSQEHVQGTDLHRVLEERGPLPVAEACDYVRSEELVEVGATA